MGLFNKQKRESKIENLKEYKTPSRDGVSTILISEINTSTIVQYRNNDKTRIIRARIKKCKSKKDMISTKNSDYIAFEILETQGLTPEIMQEAIAEYEEESAIVKEQMIYYLGRCIQSQYGYYFSYMSKETEDIIIKMIDEEERVSKERKGIMPRNTIQSKESSYRASLDARKSMQQASKPIISKRASQQIQTEMEK